MDYYFLQSVQLNFTISIFNFLLPFGLIATPAAMIIVFSYYKIILIQVAVTVIFLGLDNFLWNLGVRRYDGAGR
ncbi:hypothetical protein EFM11_08750 [Lactobacillus helveticus]|nr:ABC-2 family transporter protein [Lactobacillus helveticus]MCT0165431.1 hypothetical protein [Lactobacillus helveticus]MCT0193423.1 hypothetical protein [Lactobacillus helveticus]